MLQDFDDFMRSASPGLLQLAYTLTGSRQTAEDLVQDALLQVLARQSTLNGSADAYAKRVIINGSISRWRRLRREVLSSSPPEKPYLELENASVFTETRGLLALLPRKQRAVVVLRYLEDMSDCDIAENLGCSIATVRSQSSRALAKLRLAVDQGKRDQ